MRPRTLEIEGFTAFRTRQVIDFTALDLFVITGPTGAGKTSLLDAMALALYGQVPRMGKQGLGQLVSHGAAETRVLLEFETGGEILRIARRQPRKGAQVARIERLDGETWVDIAGRGGVRAVNEAVLERVKLDFESFCKAVVLPQGEFARFLKGDASERRATLVTLLELNAYEHMAKLARSRANELKIRGDQTRKIVEDQYADATGEALAVATTAVGTAQAAAELAQRRLGEGRTHEQTRTASAVVAAAARGYAARFTTLAGDLDGQVERSRAAETTAGDADTARTRAEAAVRAAGELRNAADDDVAAVRQRTGTRDTLARVIDAAERRPVLDARVENAARQLEAGTARVVELEAALATRQAATTTSAAALTVALDAERSARDDAKAADSERTHLTRLKGVIDSATRALADAETAAREAEAQASEASTIATGAEQTLTAAEEALAELHREHTVAGLVTGLVEGDPCPICDRPLAERPQIDAHVADRLATAEAERARVAKAMHETRERRHATRNRSALADGRLSDARSALTDAFNGHTDRAAFDASVLAAADRAVNADAALATATATAEHARAAHGDAKVAEEGATNALAAARDQQSDRDVTRATAAQDREAADAILRGHFGDVPPDAVARLTTAREELDAVEAAAATARDAVDGARTRLQMSVERHTQATGALAAIDLALGQLRARVETTRDEIERDAAAATQALGNQPAHTPLAAAARSSALPSLAGLPPATGSRHEQASTLAAWAGTASEALTSARDRARETEWLAGAALLELLASPEESVTADVALAALDQAERVAGAAVVHLTTAADSLAGRVEQRASLEAGVAADAAQISVLDVLARELRADHFIDFVVQETLDVLALRASEELHRISDGRYSLVSTDAQFSVIDHVNADERRSVKTLSGGETFLASLSLALALSKHVSGLAGEGLGAQLEAVFIDEGFGTLDPDTLGEVIDALERLREENLIIGVISHVPALAERIGVGLEVRKDGNRSTVVVTG